MVGFEKARGNSIFTLSAYFQVDATEFERVYLALKEECDLVITRRFPRRDSGVNRIQAAVFHWIISRMIGMSFKDISCGFRGMKRTVLENVYLYADLHRFLPALAVKSGFRVSEVKVKQDTRDLGIRLRGVGVYLRRLIDILTLFFLVKFTKKPSDSSAWSARSSSDSASCLRLHCGLEADGQRHRRKGLHFAAGSSLPRLGTSNGFHGTDRRDYYLHSCPGDEGLPDRVPRSIARARAPRHPHI